MADEPIGSVDFYSDPTSMDYSKLYEIQEIINAILHKKYGRDVRYALANALERVYYDASLNGNANMEVSLSRGNYATLYERINDLDTSSLNLLTEYINLKSELTNIIANNGNGTVPTEVIQLRTADNGLTYPTADVAIKKQLSQKVPFSVGENLINKLAATVGYFYSATAGTKQTNASYQYNELLSDAGITYYMNIKANIHVAYFDASRAYLGGLVDPSTFTTPPNTKYITVSYTTSQANLIMVSKTPITTYKPYVEGLDATKLLDNTLSIEKLESTLKEKIDNSVTFKPGTNLVDKNNAEVGYYRAYNTGNKVAQAVYQISYVKVAEGDTFYLQFSTNAHVAFFNVAGNYISGLIPTSASFAAPQGAVKMSVSYQIAQKDAIVVSHQPVEQTVEYEFGINGGEINSGSVTKSALSKDILEMLGEDKRVIKVGQGQEYSSLLRAIAENTTTINSYHLVNYVVDMKQEYLDYYGADFFTNYVDYSGSDFNKRGYNLKYGDALIGDNQSKIIWNYDNSNSNVCTWFSPLNLTMNNLVSNVDVKISDGSCRYIIHDDFAWGKEGVNIIMNSHFEGKSKFEQGIGGGFGFNSTYIIDTCDFENCGADAITYHVNSGTGAKNKYIVKNTYLSPGSSIRGTYYGTSTEVSQMIVTGCRADNIYVKAHTADGTSPNVNLVLKQYANETL